ncbi:MAG: hypothetical protein GY820_35810 [Gammaproteobacteria bacterium]|nr:hypothetical protein [Gammaproteobacteria bacterium]
MLRKPWGTDENGIPTNGRIVYVAVVSGICIACSSGFLVYKNGFSWHLVGSMSLLYIASMIFLIVRIRKLRKCNVEMDYPEGIREGLRNTLLLAGGFKTILKFAFAMAGLLTVAVLIRVIFET